MRSCFDIDSIGLDFGCGPGPVISHLLQNSGYMIKQYDPIFHVDQRVLESKYHYIVCCEVIEHFHSPAEEFRRLRSLLKSNGELICMTDLITDETDFAKWYYKNDPTHVFLYRRETLQYIAEEFDFAKCRIDGRLIVMTSMGNDGALIGTGGR